MDRIIYMLFFALSMLPAMAGAEPPQKPRPASPTKAEPEPTPLPPAPASAATNEESPESYSPGAAVPKQGSAWIHPTPPNWTVPAPQTYPATHVDAAGRVEDLMRRAASLVAQGNLSKAMELYNEALGLAPHYAEAYRQRALALLRLGDGVQAQVDYARFLALDPQAQTRLREEIQLFGQSGYAQVGETGIAPPAVSPGAVVGPYVVAPPSRPFRPAEHANIELRKTTMVPRIEAREATRTVCRMARRFRSSGPFAKSSIVGPARGRP